jgi:hypothetical protein
MKIRIDRLALRGLALTLALTGTAPLLAPAATPAPKSHGKATSALPKVPLHTEFQVEVNTKGQVVRVKSGKSCKDAIFNAQTYGNALQMWIRHPDGSAQTGLYKVSYDYDPKTQHVRRQIAFLQAGGSWADLPGAATQMIDTAKREAAQAANASRDLPALETIVGPSASPTTHP